MKDSSKMKESDRNNRRGFLRKILTVTASAGVAGLLLDRIPGKSVVQPVQAANPVNIDTTNMGSGTTSLQSGGNPALTATNTNNGSALQGTCTAGTGVLGTTTTGTGVQGTAGAGGTAVAGFAGDPTAIPIVAQGDTGQTANLQEWRTSSGAASVVNASGQLGIGTNSPTHSLQIHAAQQYQGMWLFSDTTLIALFLGFSPTNDEGGMELFANNVERVQLLANGPSFLNGGPVGIGTRTPAYALDVAGSVHATSFPTSSDIRFKTDIQPIKNALEKIAHLDGVYFKWNQLHRETLKRSSTLTSRQVGLIAQQVKEVLPEIVSEWADQGTDDYLAVDYSRLAAVTIEAIKELKVENNMLQNRITVLEEKIAAS